MNATTARPSRARLTRSLIVVLVAALLPATAASVPADASVPATAASVPATASSVPAAALASPLAQGELGGTYRLAATWERLPWQLVPGRYAEVIDISSGPDGTVYILDGYQSAIHVLAPDGTPRTVFAVPDANVDGEFTVRRLDVGFDGRLYVLADSQRSSGGVFKARVDRLAPDGRLLHRFELGTLVPRAFVDLAVRDDGRVYLSRAGAGNPYIEWPGPTPTPSGGGRPDNAVEVYSGDGQYQVSLAPREMAVPGNLDVALDGTLYVINRVPSPWGEPPEGPDPTPRPSLLGQPGRVSGAAGPASIRLGSRQGSTALRGRATATASDAAARASSLQQPGATPSPTPDVIPVEGVLIFAPDHRYLETVPFNGGEDVAVGAAGVFLSRNVEIHGLRETEPLHSGPAGRVVNGFFGRITFNLDVPVDGRLLAGMNHCYFQGLLVFDDPTARPSPARYLGANDAPLLEGPPYPIRLSASEEVAVLQGRFTANTIGNDRRAYATNYLFEAQTVQRWTRQGRVSAQAPLVSQLGVCAGSDSWWTRDVAIDGRDVYTVDPNLVQLRPDDRLPRWTVAPAAVDDPEADGRLIAIAADEGRAAALAAGTAKVYVIDRGGNLVARWPAAEGVMNAMPVDIAVHGDRAYLGDLGRGRVIARGLLDGSPLGEWPTHDGVRALAAGPDGSVFVLGRGGWGFRYAPDGALLAAWPMPDRAYDALDIAVDDDGRVYVSFVQPGPLTTPDSGREIIAFEIVRAGIWVFEPAQAAPLPPTDSDACLAQPGKWATPRRLLLGGEVDVTLTVEGRCPGTYDPVQIVMVLDTSRSMNFSDAIGRARDAVAELLGRLDPRAAEVALVTFEEGAALRSPLSRDIAAAGALALAEDADGDTHLVPGIELARQELTGPRGDPSARRIVLIVTDGVFYDQPQGAADAARADGLEVWALVLPTFEYNPTHRTAMEALSGNPDRVYVDPAPGRMAEMADDLVRYRAQSGLFETITIVDEVPANMRFVEGSSAPGGRWDPSDRTITWRLDRVAAADPIRLTYRLEPLEVGIWPTNVRATGPYRDALRSEGVLTFPVPEVEVYDLASAIYLPFAADRSCYRTQKPLDIVLVMDTSSSMTESAPSGGTKLAAAQGAATTFLGFLRWSSDRAALVAFDAAARRAAPLTGDRATVVRAIDELTTAQGTHIDLGLAEARRVLSDGGRREARSVVVLLTDGQNNAGPAPVEVEADRLKGAGALIYTIGLGQEIDAALLARVATTPDRYYPSPSADDLAAIYAQISESIACDVP